MQKGNISVQTENIFPIIKKFLYSDHEIFLRELISNAVDATTKLKTLSLRGEQVGHLDNLAIEVISDKEKKTLTIRDKGIGMTEEEVKKYLNQVAFSSAREFLEKYKQDAALIGNFGLGFYSSFMVAGKVEVITKSYQEGVPAVVWTCEGNPEYTLETVDKTGRGTDVILYLNEDSLEFLEDFRLRELLSKYCKFLPIPVQFGTKKETVTEGEGDSATSKTIEVPNIINNTDPAWRKNPSDLTDEDYLRFYEELYPHSFEKPLFWIHLNIDYPFNLTGVLYFPHLSNALELQRNKIQLYCNQVYVTDNVEDIVPAFLRLLHGVIDSPDIPLNVSRSYLQADSNVRKITGYISKKVADKLEELFKKDREGFEQKWNDLGVFIKYGMLADEKFHERAVKFALVHNSEGQFFPIEEYVERVKPHQTNKYDKVVLLYSHHPDQHHSQIEACRERGYEVLVMNQVIDSHFIQHLEYKLEKITFVRVDSETVDHLIEKDKELESVLTASEVEKVKQIFQEVVGDNPSAHVETKPLSPEAHPVLITRPEFMRRMKEMQAFQGMQMPGFGDTFNIVINTNNELITKKLLQADDNQQADLARHLYRLALIEQGMLTGADLSAFVSKSLELL